MSDDVISFRDADGNLRVFRPTDAVQTWQGPSEDSCAGEEENSRDVCVFERLFQLRNGRWILCEFCHMGPSNCDPTDSLTVKATILQPTGAIEWFLKNKKVIPESLAPTFAAIDASADDPQIHSQRPTPMPVTGKKRSQRGEAESKLLAGLNQHHRYGQENFNFVPIGSNDLAILAGASKGSASNFFRKKFNGYGHYERICRERRIKDMLTALNNEMPEVALYGGSPDERQAD